jgi:hypothetical protein
LEHVIAKIRLQAPSLSNVTSTSAQPIIGVAVPWAYHAHDQSTRVEQDCVLQLGALDHVIVTSMLAVTPWPAALLFSWSWCEEGCASVAYSQKYAPQRCQPF